MLRVAVAALATFRALGLGVTIEIAALALIAVFVAVTCTAVWSKKEQRREAALAVLRILRR